MQKKFPPYDISPEDLWSKIIETPRPIMHINFPRLDQDSKPVDRLTLTILTKEDFHRAQLNVAYETNQLLKQYQLTNSTSDMVENLKITQYHHEILLKCCRKYNDINKSFFPSINEINELYPEEIEQLLISFFQFQNRFGPIGLDQIEQDEWIRILTIGGSASLRFYLMGSNENIKDAFDIATSLLTEGQILAWVAARKYYLDHSKYES